MKIIKTIILSLFFISSINAQLNVSENNDATQITNFLLGYGVNITNTTINCDSSAIGFFSNGNYTSLGLNEGVAMTTGKLEELPGPNAQSSNSGINNFPGDSDLDAITNMQTFDACILEFDVESTQVDYDTIAFNYIFGSEEYLEFVASGFNDIFAFFVSGPNPAGGNYTNENIAVVPNTTTPVSINTINNITNAQNYVDNGDGNSAPQNADSSYVQFDGLTTVLEAKFAVIPNQTYHLKLAIADVADMAYDSGVYIESGSIFAKPGEITNLNESNNIDNISMINNRIIRYINDDQITTVNIYTYGGALILTEKVNQNQIFEIDLSLFDSQVYLVNVVNQNQSLTQKFVKF